MKYFFYLTATATILILSNCNKDKDSVPEGIDFRQEMRDFVIDLSNYGKNLNENFIIIPQNGQELITNNGEAVGILQTQYLQAMDATGREDIFYGYDQDDEETPQEDQQHFLSLCNLFEDNDIEVLTTDYCSTHSKMDDSYGKNFQNGYISFAADHRELNNIPDYPISPFNENNDDITDISLAKNFLYLINSENFSSKQDFINSVSVTNYDVIIMDLFHNENAFTLDEINQLKTKNNGARRMVICYMSIGEAEDYRYYWNESWENDQPDWLGAVNPDWEGNYKVWYWDSNWQKIIFGNDNSYLKKILDSGFDGVYLDIIDGFEYFEKN